MSKCVGVLYICTGPYSIFWKDFYISFEKNFIKNYKKKYFVFTDAHQIYGENSKNVRIISIKNLPWPLITLLRFSLFLSIEQELKDCDYLMFSNANMICGNEVLPDEFLPSESEILSVVQHPGYINSKKYNFPYERNKKSKAYIPWSCGNIYVIGAMYCGTRDSFLEMSRKLCYRINEDLKNNYIAKWHDESHLNRYILGKNVRVLSPVYCYPYGVPLKYQKKIYAVSKQDKFDVRSFKGQYVRRKRNFLLFLSMINNKIKFKNYFLYILDKLKLTKIKEEFDDKQ